MTDQEIPRNPNLDLAQQLFLLSNPKLVELHSDAGQRLLEGIKADKMAPFYRHLQEERLVNPTFDQHLLETMAKANEEDLAKLEEKLVDAQENLGESEISDALLAKAEYISRIGDKEAAVAAYRTAFEKTTALGSRIDILFAYMRIGFFFADNDLISRNITKAKALIEEGGDWDRRNRLKVYEGIYMASIRDFSTASELLLATLSTFTSTELMEYKEFVKYAVLCSLVSLDRVDLKKKVLDAPEVLEVLPDIPYVEDFMTSLYECKYAKFFQALGNVEDHYLKTSRLLAPHTRYYVREMRIRAYSQLLESYRSLTLASMARAFGVGEQFIDADLSRFISAGRLNCVVDKVNGVVETNRPDVKNAQYQQVVKQGDVLLNRIQKLSRVINA